jgi:hypothetical protein
VSPLRFLLEVQATASASTFDYLLLLHVFGHKIFCSLLVPDVLQVRTPSFTQRVDASCKLFRPMFVK